jgi:hypothetical protein
MQKYSMRKSSRILAAHKILSTAEIIAELLVTRFPPFCELTKRIAWEVASGAGLQTEWFVEIWTETYPLLGSGEDQSRTRMIERQ